MYLTLITQQNVDDYSDMIPDRFLASEELLGAACLDEEHEGIGCILIHPEEDRLEIRWIYVRPENRGEGAGSLLLEAVGEMSEAARAKNIEVRFEDEDLEDFWLDHGFLVMREYPRYTVDMADILAGPYAGKARKLSASCVSLYTVTARQLWEIRNNMAENGYPDYTEYCDRDYSFMVMDKEFVPYGCLICRLDPEKKDLNIMLLLIWKRTRDGIPLLLSALIDKVMQTVGDEYETVSFVARDGRMKQVAAKMAGDEAGVTYSGHILYGICEVEEKYVL